jgi:inactivated superfamily I helicase
MKGVFGLPPGADFPRLLVKGLLDRLPPDQPAALARVTVYVNTQRMRRMIEHHLTSSGARLLPKLRLITDLFGSAQPSIGAASAARADSTGYSTPSAGNDNRRTNGCV